MKKLILAMVLVFIVFLFITPVTYGSETEYLLGISLDYERKEITITVVSPGCTKMDDFLFEVKDNVLTIIRKERDTCKSMPMGVQFTYSLKEMGIDINKTFKIANSFTMNAGIMNYIRSKTPDETRVIGTLHLGKIDPYWLETGQPLYVLKGSRSEAQTNVVKLSVPAELLEKAKKLDGRHVVAVGLMNCTGNWAVGADCNMLVEQIDIAE